MTTWGYITSRSTIGHKDRDSRFNASVKLEASNHREELIAAKNAFGSAIIRVA